MRKCYQRAEYRGGEVLRLRLLTGREDLLNMTARCVERWQLARTCNSRVTYLGWDVPGVEADGVIAIIVPLVPF